MSAIRSSITALIRPTFVLAVFLVAPLAHAATLSLSPATGVYSTGQVFTARVLVNTAGQAINAAQGTVSFQPSQLKVVAVSKGSVFNLWTSDPTFSNTAGTVSFSGGATPPGYTGGAGTVLSITFRAVAAGNPKVEFNDGAVLAADGKGTNVLTGMNGASYTIAAAQTTPKPEVIQYVAPANTPAAPVVTSTTDPNQNDWYTATSATLSWKLPNGIVAVRTLLNDNSGTIPTKVYNDPISTIALHDLTEGIEYFHLQFKNKNGWGKVADYRLAIDHSKPSSFTISLPPNADTAAPQQVLVLKAVDAVSGIDHYKVQLDGGSPYLATTTASSTITLPKLEPGHHTVIIEAFDKAGNSLISTFAFDIAAFGKPVFTDYPTSVPASVIPVITGKTRPNATVKISVHKLGADIQTVTVISDGNGVFRYIPDSRLSLGVYELIAIAIDKSGAQSDPSDAIRIAVEQPGYLRIGTLAVNALSVFVPLLALLILLIVGAWSVVRRLRSLRRGVSKETHEALTMLSDQFSAMRAELEEQTAALTSSRKTGRLTKAEDSLVTHMAHVLDEAETRVRKEITDVEDIIE